MKEIIFLVEEAPEGGFLAQALGHSAGEAPKLGPPGELVDRCRASIIARADAASSAASARRVPAIRGRQGPTDQRARAKSLAWPKTNR